MSSAEEWKSSERKSECDIPIHPPITILSLSLPYVSVSLALFLSLSFSLSLLIRSPGHIRLQVLLCTSGTDRLIGGRQEKSVYGPGPRPEWLHWGGGAQVRMECVCAWLKGLRRDGCWCGCVCLWTIATMLWPPHLDAPQAEVTAWMELHFLPWTNRVIQAGSERWRHFTKAQKEENRASKR